MNGLAGYYALEEAAAPSSPNLLLDDITGAGMAYSLHLLTNAQAGGWCARLRRGSDNDELDFGFTVDNYLDIDAVNSWLGGSVGYLVTWYDQSGNENHARQTDPLLQPQLIQEDGFWTFQFGSGNYYLTTDSNPISGNMPRTVVVTNKGNDDFLFTLGTKANNQDYRVNLGGNEYTLQIQGDNTGASGLTGSQRCIFSVIHDGSLDLSGSTLYQRTTGGQLSDNNQSSALIDTQAANIIIGNNSELSASTSFSGTISDFLLWPEDLTNDLTQIENTLL